MLSPKQCLLSFLELGDLDTTDCELVLVHLGHTVLEYVEHLVMLILGHVALRQQATILLRVAFRQQPLC